jgi:Lrp/AsnC family leucine-responsive transcriptional regulator
MDLGFERLLDRTGLKILRALQENARLSFSQLGRQVALSPPAVAERVRRMEEVGIITGYHAQVEPDKVGLPIMAFITLKTRADKYPEIMVSVRRAPEILECHHVSGGESFVIKVVASSIPHLERVIERLSPFGETSTLIVLSSPVVKQVLDLEEKQMWE